MNIITASTFNQVWADAQQELIVLLVLDVPCKSLPSAKQFQHLAKLFLRYLQLLRQLEQAYEEIVHPQKRRDIRPVLEAVMGRLVELKVEMVEVDSSEYHYLDDVLVKLKLTPADMEIPIPRYFRRNRRDTAAPAVPSELTLQEAIRIIQGMERTRRRVRRAAHLEWARARRDCDAQSRREERPRGRDAPLDRSPAGFEVAAVLIQKVWRGHFHRRRVNRAREEEHIILGMDMDPMYLQPTPAEVTARANEARRRKTRQENEEGYQRALVSLAGQLRDEEGPDLQQTMKDQIRQWFIECRDTTGCFPDYPEEEDGGSALLFIEKTPQQLMAEMAPNLSQASQKQQGKGNKGKPDEKKAQEKTTSSAFLEDFKKGINTFKDFWENRDESDNFSQRHDVEMIKEEKRKEMESEFRLQVDEQMRKELADLKLAVDKTTAGKKAPAKKKGEKKGKKVKDPTADRSLESLCEELVETGLLRQADDVKMEDYLGDYLYRRKKGDSLSSLFDVRQLLKLYAVLPLGSQVVHERAPLIKSILLVGPTGVGKKMLVHAVCRETGANLFDLSPVNTAGKYLSKTGVAMIIHMVFKVARLMQPSVIWVGDVEKMFYKKVPKEEKQLNPKRLKKALMKALKSIKAEDRILVLATSSDPTKADNSLTKAFGTILLICQPDYTSRCMLWRQLIEKHGGKVTVDLDVGSLATLSDGFTPGQMDATLRAVLTRRRVRQQAVRPLATEELIEPLAKMSTVFEEEKSLEAWYASYQMSKTKSQPTNV